MHYHLYKNPKRGKRLINGQKLLNAICKASSATQQTASKNLEKLRVLKVNYNNSIDLRSIAAPRKINWGELDKITAGLLILSAALYLVFVNPMHRIDSAELDKTSLKTAAAKQLEKNKPVEIVGENAVKIPSRYVPSAIAIDDKRINSPADEKYLKLLKVKNAVQAMLEEEARMAPEARIVKVEKGDTLVALLMNKANVPAQDAFEAVEALRPLYDPRSIAPGNEITVFFHKDPGYEANGFSGIKLDQDTINSVIVKRSDGGEYSVRKAVKNVYKMVKSYKGTIRNSLYVDAKNQGVPDYIIADLITMYSWNVDFQRDMREGTKFEVMYEEYKTDDNKTVTNRGKVLYARLNMPGNDLPYFRFEDKDGFVDYYDDNGKSARKVLMKTPINGARISSGYGMRKHPIMGYSKMHQGLDFAAPPGTPIYASGNGSIEQIGPWSTYGNYIRISHRNGLKTAYAHMKGFASGLHKGDKVTQGEVIGYVGTTGRSTGPHLHYEVILNNKKVNPASLDLPTGITLKGKELAKFQKAMSNTMAEFRNDVYSNEVATKDSKANSESSIQ